MPLWKRAFDVLLAAVLLVPGLPLMAGIWVLVRFRDGPPAIYPAIRMGAPGRTFTMWKFRTMTVDRYGPEIGVSGGDKQDRITPLGGFLRRSRLDELPQLVNVLSGDISFVGPRPPARRYVEMFPALYGEVLQCRPGLTGLATVVFHRHEEALLAATSTAAETEAVYVRRCVPRKARLDRIYHGNRSLGLDLYILYLTAGKFLPLPSRRLHRSRRPPIPSGH